MSILGAVSGGVGWSMLLPHMQQINMPRAMSYLAACAIALATTAAHGGPGKPAFEHAISNIPGKSLVAVEVNLAPGEITKPHHHAPSAFIYVYVLSGTVRSQVEGEPAHDYHAGDTWFEAPGAHHMQARNLSTSQPAKFLAVIVVDTNDKPLTTLDKE
jgi:quercetin dioxygenase-like cupin family protein